MSGSRWPWWAAFLLLPLFMHGVITILAYELDSSRGTFILVLVAAMSTGACLGLLRQDRYASLVAAAWPAPALAFSRYYALVDMWPPDRPMRRLATAAGLDNRAWPVLLMLACALLAEAGWECGIRTDPNDLVED